MFSRKGQDDRSIVALIAGAVRRDISFGDLPPDAKLKIEELRRRYGGSNHSVREALTQLTAEGLVEANAQRGFRVSSATEEDLRDIIRMRAELDPIGLRWSMERGDVAWEGRLMAAGHAADRATEQVLAEPEVSALAWDEAGRAFHAALMEACGSPRLIAVTARLYDQSRRFRLANLREGLCDPRAVAHRQKALLTAILDHDQHAATDHLVADIESDLARAGVR
ncbi:GntR family transcriptional regulator [Tranquillimonas alkanivorans]|uniref:Transcriptional regulator, GntR family n=1 Tax=Tranquillimonas alkanivorans TaxID=441119 RepID=A0A1I5T310_9RHOB|nr:GntR family transcriptional regulator [Tranquillimonas alkanivorans]SFP77444.1 transcriptional regulator, GntR family [Tranquillimonas alkanivorans]